MCCTQVHESTGIMTTTLVGVISDTHGLLRPEAVAALHGFDLIIHAGDIGGPEVIERLCEVAPSGITTARGALGGRCTCLT